MKEDVAQHVTFPYCEVLGFLNHAAVNSRPDIAHAVSQLAQFSSCYGAAHVTAAKHLLQYIKGTTNIGIVFRQNSVNLRQLCGVADTNYANDVDTRRSTTGYTITIGGSTVCWKSRCQSSVALSATEAEYMGMGDCVKHLIWFR